MLDPPAQILEKLLETAFQGVESHGFSLRISDFVLTALSIPKKDDVRTLHVLFLTDKSEVIGEYFLRAGATSRSVHGEKKKCGLPIRFCTARLVLAMCIQFDRCWHFTPPPARNPPW